MATIQEELKQNRYGYCWRWNGHCDSQRKSEILSIELENEIISIEDKGMLQDLITAATNDALRKVKAIGKEEMAKLTGGMNIPGVSNLFS